MSQFSEETAIEQETLRCSRDLCNMRIRRGNIYYADMSTSEILCPDCYASIESLFASIPPED